MLFVLLTVLVLAGFDASLGAIVTTLLSTSSPIANLHVVRGTFVRVALDT